jgi:hypothetical protein
MHNYWDSSSGQIKRFGPILAAVMHPGRLFNIVAHVSWKQNRPKPVLFYLNGICSSLNDYAFQSTTLCAIRDMHASYGLLTLLHRNSTHTHTHVISINQSIIRSFIISDSHTHTHTHTAQMWGYCRFFDRWSRYDESHARLDPHRGAHTSTCTCMPVCVRM